MKIRNYHELNRLATFDERFEYLKLGGEVGVETFGFDRFMNQELYKTSIWKKVRRDVILRDEGYDLGDPDYPIGGPIIVHHMNPITLDDIKSGSDKVFDPDFLICCSHLTHNAIHYGDSNLLPKSPIIRRPGDTCPWRR